ncbi:MAG: RNA 3'-terminal-phosphate cyclase [Deltaproteobacteria bacterium RIFOXYD12_FULL_57_12]|nr:MAG: RNA 3'-terminal-phosphate cyclase [Deltaproteobacteria bacterium RIFOXYD12_FULL_57_12]
MAEIVRIDGGLGEGGGQILRTALALAALCQQPVELVNIRARRRKPGLRPQHLAAVQALAAITGGAVEGAAEHSRCLLFTPGAIRGGSFRFAVGTAGATTLVLAAILPPLLFARESSTITIIGGTHVPFSPPFPYLDGVFLPALQSLGGRLRASLDRWGWYPEGGGVLRAAITPGAGLRALRRTERGLMHKLSLLVARSNLPAGIAAREEAVVRNRLAAAGYDVQSRLVEAPANGSGNLVFLRGLFGGGAVGFGALGRRGLPAEQVAAQVCRQWLAFAAGKAAMDCWLADQLVLYLALAAGESELAVDGLTAHLLTNIAVIERFLPVRFVLDHDRGRVRVTGCGWGGA